MVEGGEAQWGGKGVGYWGMYVGGRTGGLSGRGVRVRMRGAGTRGDTEERTEGREEGEGGWESEGFRQSLTPVRPFEEFYLEDLP